MRNIHVGLLAFGAAAVLGIGPASSQVAISGTYYEETKNVDACSGGTCTITFTPTPSSGPNVLFTKVNCLLANLPGELTTIHFGVRDTLTGSSRRREYLAVPQAQVQGTLRYYSIVAPSDFLFGPGKIPTIVAGVTASSNSAVLDCKITGRLQQ